MIANKNLCEMSKQEIENIAKKQFFSSMAMEVPCQAFVISVTPEFCEVTRIWHEALEIYIKEYFNESD